MRNFDISPDSLKRPDFAEDDGPSEVRWEASDGEKGAGDGVEGCAEELEKINLHIYQDSSPETLNYIQQLELELSAANQVSDFIREI